MNLSFSKSCAGKHKHPSMGAAEAHIRSLERRGLLRWPMRAYQCTYCRRFHVGRRPRKR